MLSFPQVESPGYLLCFWSNHSAYRARFVASRHGLYLKRLSVEQFRLAERPKRVHYL